MHDLLQEMGWEIVRQESEDPRKRSRLWRLEDFRLLEDDKVTDSVKAISFNVLELRLNDFDLRICPAAFEKMTNLRFIKFYGLESLIEKSNVVVFKQDLKFLSNELRFFHWDCYPNKSLPSDFNPKNLVQLRIENSDIELLWSSGEKDLVNLRVLDLRSCTNLRKIPNLSQAMKLEELRCMNCWNLVELPSMEHLMSLQCLHLVRCLNLKRFPAVPIHLIDLVLLQSGIEEVPDSIVHLQHLGRLCLDKTRIENVPSSIKCLDKLQVLTIAHTTIRNLPSSIAELHALRVIKLDHCSNITIYPDFPEEIEEIHMMRSSIEEIPFSISRLKSLKKLNLIGSRELKSLRGLPPFRQELHADDCMSIETVSFADPDNFTFCEENVCHCIAFDSFKLKGDAMDNIVANALLRIYCFAEKSTVELLKETKEKEIDGKIYRISNHEDVLSSCFLRAGHSLEPFEHQSRDSSIIVELDPDKCSSNLLGFAFGILLDESEKRVASRVLRCKYQLKTSSGECHNFMTSMPLNTCKEGQYILFDRVMVHEAMPYVEASFQFVTRMKTLFNVYDFKVKKYGVHVFYTDAADTIQLSDGAEICSEIFDPEEEDERSFSPDDGHEQEPNDMKTSLCLSIDGLQRLLQNVISLFKGKVEEPEDASS